MAENKSPAEDFKPYISAKDFIPEFTLKAVILGAIFGVIFGASSVYLGLKVGMTVSASIPIAVLAISVFKKIGNATILENNIVQTIGSAGESVAAGVVFTIPALLFLPGGMAYFKYFQIFVLAFFHQPLLFLPKFYYLLPNQFFVILEVFPSINQDIL